MPSCSSCCDGVSKFYVGDIGVRIEVDTCSDITTATLVVLRVEKPDGTTHDWVGTVYDTTKILYIVGPGDFDQEGRYRLQPYIEMPSWQGQGNTATFKVHSVFA